jgi:hypothetical protein
VFTLSFDSRLLLPLLLKELERCMAGWERGPPIEDAEALPTEPFPTQGSPPMHSLNVEIFLVTDGQSIRNATTNRTEAETRARMASERGRTFHVEAVTCSVSLPTKRQSLATPR